MMSDENRVFIENDAVAIKGWVILQERVTATKLYKEWSLIRIFLSGLAEVFIAGEKNTLAELILSVDGKGQLPKECPVRKTTSAQ